MRNKIWYALCDAKKGDEYLTLYSMRVKSRRKKYKIFIIVIAAIGLALWKVWEPIAAVSCALILLSELATKLENQVLMSDADLIKLNDLRIKYIELFNRLERLWADLNDECLQDDEVKGIYADILNDKIEIEKIDNELYIPLIKSIDKKASETTSQYLNNHYG